MLAWEAKRVSFSDPKPDFDSGVQRMIRGGGYVGGERALMARPSGKGRINPHPRGSIGFEKVNRSCQPIREMLQYVDARTR